MSNSALLDGKGKNREELEALEVAESARELNWTRPSFVADLFMGRLRTKSVLPYPEQTEADRRIGDDFLRKIEPFLKKYVDADAIDRAGELGEPVLNGMRELDLFGMKIPKEYGGLGLSQVNYNRALALCCSYSASVGATLSAHQSIGVPQPLQLFGTEAQKKKYLPRMARGEISAFALTETGVGSDPAQMSTTATPTADGDHYIINGEKLWCTNGAIAEIMVVMAQTPPKFDKGREKKQITAFIVEKGMPGLEIAHRCRFMGLNGIYNAQLRFKDVKVPKENIIWGTGKGLRLALITLNAGRLSLPSACIGGLRRVLELSRDWGNERKQWGASVGRHEAGAHKIAFNAAHLFAMEAITWLSGVWVDQKSHDIRLEAAMAKLFGSEWAHRIIEDFLQLRGGRGYETAASLQARGEKPIPTELMLRDSRINMIVEGTSEILRLFTAREALDRHLGLAGDVLSSRLGWGKRLATAARAASFYAGWYPWQWIAPLFNRLFVFRHAGLPGGLGRHLRYAEAASHRLARSIFHLMVLNGPRLERRQLQLMRVVDIATDLFAMAATVGRAAAWSAKDGSGNCVDLAQLFCREARDRVEANFRALRRNADGVKVRVARDVLDGRSLWLESHYSGQALGQANHHLKDAKASFASMATSSA